MHFSSSAYFQDYSTTFRSALRVDPLLAGDKETVEKALRAAGYGIADVEKYLHDWCDTMQPEYMMVSLNGKTSTLFCLAPNHSIRSSTISLV